MTVYFSELCFIDLDQISCDISAVPSASFSTFLQNFEKNDLGKDLRNIQGDKNFGWILVPVFFGWILIPANFAHAESINKPH